MTVKKMKDVDKGYMDSSIDYSKEFRPLFSPKAIAIWTDVKYPKRFVRDGKEQGEPKFAIGIRIEDEADSKAFAAELTAINDEYYNGFGGVGDQRNIGADIKVNKDGKQYFAFRTGAANPPVVKDSQGNIVDDIPENFIGSTVQVCLRTGPSHFKGDGANFYFNSVQILDLSRGGGMDFPEAEGTYVASAPARVPSNPAEVTAPNSDLDDEIPF